MFYFLKLISKYWVIIDNLLYKLYILIAKIVLPDLKNLLRLYLIDLFLQIKITHL